MTSLVLEIQRDALDQHTSTSMLLRKALAISKKLSIPHLPSWIERELNGYGEYPIPQYRKIQSVLRALTPYQGWIPVAIDDADFMNTITMIEYAKSISSIENILSRDSRERILHIPFTGDIESSLSRLMDCPFHITRHIDESQLHNIIDSVRTIVLDWSLDLERGGILGEGMSFSEQERATAATSNYNVFNISGDAAGIQIQQASPEASQSQSIDWDCAGDLIPLLKQAAAQLNLSDSNKADIEAAADTLGAQLRSSQSSRTLIIHETLRSVRAILEGTAGSLLAVQILEAITRMLGK